MKASEIGRVFPGALISKSEHYWKEIRGKLVLQDRNVAEITGWATADLNRFVNRHPALLPDNLAFRLSPDEAERAWVFSESGHVRKAKRKMPRVFTVAGVLQVLWQKPTERVKATLWLSRWLPILENGQPESWEDWGPWTQGEKTRKVKTQTTSGRRED
ncbi:MAG: ORF6N domain-containing protein [Planctomycetota bacterium]|nr:ORF6N domain-containing protein [Planctomycetota bacterium]